MPFYSLPLDEVLYKGRNKRFLEEREEKSVVPLYERRSRNSHFSPVLRHRHTSHLGRLTYDV